MAAPAVKSRRQQAALPAATAVVGAKATAFLRLGPDQWRPALVRATVSDMRLLYAQFLHTPTQSTSRTWLRRALCNAAESEYLLQASLRRSGRRAAPRSMEVLPSAAWHLAPGPAAVGRRLRVFWPAPESAWFSGQVEHWDEGTGRHSVVYDDGDCEELLLAAEQIEWIHSPGTQRGADFKPATVELRSHGPDVASPDTAPRSTPAGWPGVGDFLWGHVKGHGWWPAQAAEPPSDRPPGTVWVQFFDNTSGWVSRADCQPFAAHFTALSLTKRLPAFVKAVQLAWDAWSETLPPGERQPFSLAPYPATSRRRFARSRRASTAARRLLPASCSLGDAAHSPGAASGEPADVAGLSRRLLDLQARLVPLAAQAHERVATALRTLPFLEPRRPRTPCEGVLAQERLRLISQLNALGRVPQSVELQPTDPVEALQGCNADVALPEAAAPPPPATVDGNATEASSESDE